MTNNANTRLVKCVCVGDPTVGKTSLLITYTTNCFPAEYCPTIYDNYDSDVLFEGRAVHLNLVDTAGNDEYDRLRHLSYTNADVVLVLFAVNSKTSYDNVNTKWVPEVRSHLPTTPFLLVGTKSDTRQGGSQDGFVSTMVARSMAKRQGADCYLECSAATQANIASVFDGALRAALQERKRRAWRCRVL